MKQEEINNLVERYYEMSDEELSFLIVTRLDSLTEEAREALNIVISTRDPAAFDNELNATFNDVKSQVVHAKEEISKQEKQSTNTKNSIRYLCIILVAMGGLIMIFSDYHTGLKFVKPAIGILIFFEVIYLIQKFTKALLHSEPSNDS